jgi:hypothetical protein
MKPRCFSPIYNLCTPRFLFSLETEESTGFQVPILVAGNVKIAFFWDVSPYSLVDRFPCLGESCCLRLQCRSGDGSSMYLRHFGVYQTIRGQTTVDRILRHGKVLEVTD